MALIGCLTGNYVAGMYHPDREASKRNAIGEQKKPHRSFEQ
jgi:hypothetical protein